MRATAEADGGGRDRHSASGARRAIQSRDERFHRIRWPQGPPLRCCPSDRLSHFVRLVLGDEGQGTVQDCGGGIRKGYHRLRRSSEHSPTGGCFRTDCPPRYGIRRIEHSQTFRFGPQAVFPSGFQVRHADGHVIRRSRVQVAAKTAFPKAARNMVTLRNLANGRYNMLLFQTKIQAPSITSWRRSMTNS